MAMKKILLFIAIITAPCFVTAQNAISFHKLFQIKLSPFEVLYEHYRVGIGVEKKFTRHAIWGSIHIGQELAGYAPVDAPQGYFTYKGIQTGFKWIFPHGIGEYF